MRILARVQAISLRYAPAYCLCIILGAYLSLQAVGAATLIG
jgi:hypothetical protein